MCFDCWVTTNLTEGSQHGDLKKNDDKMDRLKRWNPKKFRKSVDNMDIQTGKMLEMTNSPGEKPQFIRINTKSVGI